MKNLLLIFLFSVLSINIFAQSDLKPYPGYSGLVMLKSSKWPSNSVGKTTIEVSWDNPTLYNAQGRKWVQEAIEETWEKYGNIEFVGWGKSSPNSKGIRIIIDNYGHPHTKGLGTMLDGRPEGMLLNFEFSGNFKCIGYSKENCIKYVAVHEFGHALGFAHEHNRTDCKCAEEPQGTSGDLLLTYCDPNSIMNYCNPKWANWGELSDLDKSGLVKTYGSRGSSSSKIEFVEIRFVPCGTGSISPLNSIKNIINRSSSFSVNKFTEEDQDVPLKAVNNLTSESLTIRYFHPDDKSKADELKDLLVSNGYRSVGIQNMMPRMPRCYPKYIEIWNKELN